MRTGPWVSPGDHDDQPLSYRQIRRSERVPPVGDRAARHRLLRREHAVAAGTDGIDGGAARGLCAGAASRSRTLTGSNSRWVVPSLHFGLQGQEHPAIGGPRQPFLRDRRPEHIAGELFESVAVVGWRHGGRQRGLRRRGDAENA
jgi:hypothetical protein